MVVAAEPLTWRAADDEVSDVLNDVGDDVVDDIVDDEVDDVVDDVVYTVGIRLLGSRIARSGPPEAYQAPGLTHVWTQTGPRSCRWTRSLRSS
jgi:hypothetical protein